MNMYTNNGCLQFNAQSGADKHVVNPEKVFFSNGRHMCGNLPFLQRRHTDLGPSSKTTLRRFSLTRRDFISRQSTEGTRVNLHAYELDISLDVKPKFYQRWARRTKADDSVNFPAITSTKANLSNLYQADRGKSSKRSRPQKKRSPTSEKDKLKKKNAFKWKKKAKQILPKSDLMIKQVNESPFVEDFQGDTFSDDDVYDNSESELANITDSSEESDIGENSEEWNISLLEEEKQYIDSKYKEQKEKDKSHTILLQTNTVNRGLLTPLSPASEIQIRNTIADVRSNELVKVKERNGESYTHSCCSKSSREYVQLKNARLVSAGTLGKAANRSCDIVTNARTASCKPRIRKQSSNFRLGRRTNDYKLMKSCQVSTDESLVSVSQRQSAVLEAKSPAKIPTTSPRYTGPENLVVDFESLRIAAHLQRLENSRAKRRQTSCGSVCKNLLRSAVNRNIKQCFIDTSGFKTVISGCSVK